MWGCADCPISLLPPKELHHAVQVGRAVLKPLWACDGRFPDGSLCGFIGSEEECETHIKDQNNDLSSIVCWGFMMVGTSMYRRFREGFAPMSLVVGLVSDAYFEYLEEVEFSGPEDGTGPAA